jgi:hypothetical protein
MARDRYTRGESAGAPIEVRIFRMGSAPITKAIVCIRPS